MTPAPEWWTETALAESGLPDIPDSRQGVNALSRRLNWRNHPQFARRREDRGGGWEYHWKLLPLRAQTKLIAAEKAAVPEPRRDRDEVWSWFDGLPQAVKDKARDRLTVIDQVEAMERGLGRNLAVEMIAQEAGVSARSVWNWFGLIMGVPAEDRLAYIAPRHRAVERQVARAEAPDFFNYLKGDYLRVDGPSFRAAYDNAVKIAKAKGWPWLKPRTADRRMKEIPRVTRVFAREGVAGLEKCFPPQTRDRTQMVAMEGVVADCHKFDVFVQWPGVEKPMRPQIVVFQDIYSGRVLSWRIDRDPNKVAVMSAFGELIEDYGIPRHCLFDNGREFANKWLTGGTETRFRFKVREDDPLGVLPQLGIKMHWARPYHGQSKPVERTFRDFADRIARDPRFAGAYVGHKPDAKPENYGSRAIPLEDFVRIVGEGVEDHNAREGRLSETCKGRSFDQTFAESYARTPVRKATDEQRRLWLMGQHVVKLHANHGQIRVRWGGADEGHAEYWSEWMNEYAGQKMVARFDPEDLNAGLYLYALGGEYLGFAETKVKTPFFDLVGAREAGAQDRRRKRAHKAYLEAARPVDVAAVAAALDQIDRPEPPAMDSKVVELVQKARGPIIDRPVPAPDEGAVKQGEHEAFILAFEARRAAPAQEESAADRFWRALDVERKSEAGAPIGSAEAEFWNRYRDTPEYRSMRRAYDQWGASAIG